MPVRRWIFFLFTLILGVSPVRADDLWPELSRPPQATGGGEKDAAVIVGVEKYAFVESVPGAKENADAWQAYLTETLKVPPEKVALLRDDDATNDEIRQAAAEKAAQVKPGGTLWFVFIGHGAPSQDGKDGLLVGVDAQQKAESVYKRSLSRNELLETLAKGKQDRTVVLIDACFSGKAPSGRDLVANLQPLVTMRNLPLGLDSRTILLTAARSDQFAGPLPKAGKPRPAFSYLALGALRGWAADASGQVTAAGSVEYAKKVLSLAHDRTQTPELSAGAPGAVLGKGREGAPDLGKIDREGAAGFQVTNLPAVPIAEAPKELGQAASGLDLASVDVDALEEYDGAVKFDKGPAEAAEKAEAWRQLAADAPKFADLAGKRAQEWDHFAAQKKAAAEAKERRVKARDADWGKLSRLLTLGVVAEADKGEWANQFLKAYGKSPGVDWAMARGLAPHIPEGPLRSALENRSGAKAGEGKPGRGAATAEIQWIAIPGGSFTMGSGDSGTDNEKPAHAVTIKPFQMAKTLVTNKQYKACVEAGACAAPSSGFPSEGDDRPVVGVDWNQARAFSTWAGGRLPSEAEWEYAARGAGKDRKYPWGDEEATCERAVIAGCASASAPVCSKPAGNTPQGLCDMAGNAWEWVEDWYHGSYEGAPADGGAWEDAGSDRVNRGGSWFHGAGFARSALRRYIVPSYRDDRLGFRPVR